MNAQLILNFLRDVTANNNRIWFQEHKADYEAAKKEWEQAIEQLRKRIITFDLTVANQPLKDCTYRFYRDTRFSPDKSPYKRHFGAYINAKGKKALRGGYYIHLEPDHCQLAVGNYWLPTDILTSCRNEIMANEEEWLKCVETPEFLKLFDTPETTLSWEDSWDAPQGFGLTKLKTCPSGFPRDYKYVKYLRQKDYCAWRRVDESFFEADLWLDKTEQIFRTAKPMMDFINGIIDDYE